MRIGRQFFIFCLVVVAATQVLNSALSISSFERVYSRSILSQFEVLVQDLKVNIEAGLKKYKSYSNYVGVETIFQKILTRRAQDRIDSVLATDTRGRVLYLSHHGENGVVFKKFDKKDGYYLKDGFFDDFSFNPKATSTHTLNDANIISAPVMNGGVWEGNVSIVFSGKFVAEEVYAIIKRNLVLFAIIMTACGILLAIFFPLLLKRQNTLDAFENSSGGGGEGGPVLRPEADYRKLKAYLTSLIVAVLLISQMVFSYLNLKSFESDYLRAIMDKTDLMSTILKEDIEYLLNKGLPINKLVGIDKMMAGIVLRTPEYASLEIIDTSGNLLYLADPRERGVLTFRPGQNGGHTVKEDGYHRVIPIGREEGTIDGYVKVAIDENLIESRIKSVLLDYLSVVIVAMLISFEISLFFIARHFVVRGARTAGGGGPVRAVTGSDIRTLGFLNMFGSFLFMSFFSLFMKEVSRPLWGLSKEFVTGLPISIYMLAASGGYILKDVVQDRIGPRGTLLTGSLIFAAGLFLTGTAADVVQVIFAQVLAGIGFGIVYLIPQNMIIDNTDPDRRAAALSDLFAGFYAGIICGSATGGIMAERLGYRSVFILSSVVVLLTYIFGHFCLPGGKARGMQPAAATDTAGQAPARLRLATLLKDGRFMIPLLTQGVLYQFVYAGFLFFILPLFLKSIGFSESDIGRTVMLHGLVIIMGPMIIRFFSRHMRPETQLIMAGIVIGALLIGSRAIFGLSAAIPLVACLVPWIVAIAVCNCIQSSGIVPVSMSSPVAVQVGTARALSTYRLIERTGNIGAPVLCSVFLGWFSAGGLGSGPYENTMALIGALFLAGTAGFALLPGRKAARKE